MKAEPNIREKFPAKKTEERTSAPLLQVMICTCGADGIERVSKGRHPRMPETEYLVSWQTDGSTPLPAELERPDMKIFRTATKGLSVNRNHALGKATAPLLLISDDDVDYTEEMLRHVIEAFGKNPDCDVLAFKYESAGGVKKSYPEESFPLTDPPKGYYVSSIEIAMRREAIQGKIWFNEWFGIGALFPAGEEDVFLHDCKASGIRGRYIPATIARHDSDTTSGRNRKLPEHARIKGAVFSHTHPGDWPLRMAVNAIREARLWIRKEGMPPATYISNWLKGVREMRKNSVFPTPDYSDKYLNK